MKSDALGARTTFGTVGGPAADAATSVAVDGGSHAFVTGWTRSFFGGPTRCVKVDTNATAPIVFALNFGGSPTTRACRRCRSAGNAVVAVETHSADSSDNRRQPGDEQPPLAL
jgi:hypothetical protein